MDVCRIGDVARMRMSTWGSHFTNTCAFYLAVVLLPDAAKTLYPGLLFNLSSPDFESSDKLNYHLKQRREALSQVFIDR